MYIYMYVCWYLRGLVELVGSVLCLLINTVWSVVVLFLCVVAFVFSCRIIGKVFCITF